jgi:two-component system NtrC family response regulator
MQAAEIEALQVRAALALGRHAEALATLRRARRGRRRLAPEEAEALLGVMRPREALRVATRALQGECLDPDAAVELHLQRARALWQMGESRRALAEAARAGERARAAATHARARVTLALFAWKEQRLEDAARLAREALGLYEGASDAAGVVWALEIEAGILRDTGRFDEALRVCDRRVEAAAATTRVDEQARARADRGDLLAFLGRWDAAAAELDASVDLFRRLADEREHTLARPRRAMVDLARGDLAAVRQTVERARACAFDAPRLRAEHQLLASDLQLAAGDAAGAETEARGALGSFAAVRCSEGTSRARARLALALVAQGRAAEARRAAARAAREAPGSRRDLRVLALLALGRAELRLGARLAAARTFDAALALVDARSGPAAAARLGLLLARGGSDAERAQALGELEAWGDRRLLAYALDDLRALALVVPEPAEPPGAAGEDPVEPCPQVSALAAAAEALLAGDSWGARFAAALSAVRSALGFCRAAWVGPGALELRPDGGVSSLPADDLARSVAAAARGAAVVDLGAAPFAHHPTRALFDLRQAVVLPAPPAAAWLYADFREAAPADARQRLAPLARLLAAAADAGGEPGTPRDDAFPEILGECEALRQLRATIGRVGRSGLAVHVFGETGTGKEKVAAALHRASGRRGRLVCVNAAQLDDELFDSTLFGHVKGAFTGATSDALGHVGAAEGGTLFLDEVTELTPRGQAKLLRFLETMEYTRVGDPRPRRADVRVLSAANVGLAERVRERRFREDLTYRVADFTLALPPLRERGEDVLLLARHFLRVHALAEGVSCPRLSAGASRGLLAHSWPGNVRELVKQMHRAVVLAESGVVQAAHLQLGGEAPPGGRPTLREARAALERDMVARYLAAHAGCRTRAADALGITRQALALKLRQLGLS